jgi:hypothetical protein
MIGGGPRGTVLTEPSTTRDSGPDGARDLT